MQSLTPIPGSMAFGEEFTLFELPVLQASIPDADLPEPAAGTASAAILRFGVVICFEDTVAPVYRRFVEQGVDFMVNLTNDGWFKQSSEPAIHLANAIFRAVENRRPLVRCTNTGITCVVDECGFVRIRQAPFEEGVLNVVLSLPARGEPTFYTRQGDVFALGCVLVAGGWFGIAALRSFRLKSAA
jgi:apolipoprotein N-acyltransferase